MKTLYAKNEEDFFLIFLFFCAQTAQLSEFLINHLGNRDKYYTERAPKERKGQAYLPQKVERAVGVIPHGKPKPEVENQPEDKLYRRNTKRGKRRLND